MIGTDRKREYGKPVLAERFDDDIGARGVMITVIENEHDDPSKNPGRSCLHLI